MPSRRASAFDRSRRRSRTAPASRGRRSRCAGGARVTTCGERMRMDDWLTGAQDPARRLAEVRSSTSSTTTPQGFFDFISIVLGAVIEAMTDGLLWFPPLLLVALLGVATWLLHRSIGLAVGGRPRPPPHHQSRLLAGDHRDAVAGRLRDARLRRHRRADRHRRGAPAVALHRHPADPRPDADHPDLRLSHPDPGPLRPRHGARA